MKNKLVGLFSLAFILIPGLSLAATSSFEGLINIPMPELPPFNQNILTCSVEGTVSRPNSTTNKITYKVHYESNYALMNGRYTVYGNVARLPANQPLYQAAGAASFNKGTGYISIAAIRSEEHTSELQ